MTDATKNFQWPTVSRTCVLMFNWLFDGEAGRRHVKKRWHLTRSASPIGASVIHENTCPPQKKLGGLS